jgi:hypothetical protein
MRLVGRRNSPEIQDSADNVGLCLRLPIAHLKSLRNDARARLQFAEQLRLQAKIDAGKQKQSDHGGVVNVRVEKIAAFKANQVGDAGFFSVGLRLLD